MLMDKNSRENSEKAYDTIEKIRDSPTPERFDAPRYVPDIDYKSVRPFHPSSMDNWQKLTKAKTMADLLDTDSEMFEPPLTIGIPLDQLKAQADQGDVLKFPQLPCHSQSVERIIQLVTKVSSKVRSYKRRHHEILCKLYHRKLKAQRSF